MTEHMTERSGLWWPSIDTDAHGVITADCLPAIAQVLHHVRGRDCIVQAGGNVGTYALALADSFRSVITAEPDPLNYACLTKNLDARDALQRVTAFRAAFGADIGECSRVVVKPCNVGAHRVAYGPGDISVITIDSLNLPRVDCIWADVEGAELFLLKGAAKTIERFSPVLICEDKGLDQQFFGAPPGSLQDWLAPFGYIEVGRVGLDKIFKRV